VLWHSGVPELIAGIFEAAGEFGKLNPASYHPAGDWNWPKRDLLVTPRQAERLKG